MLFAIPVWSTTGHHVKEAPLEKQKLGGWVFSLLHTGQFHEILDKAQDPAVDCKQFIMFVPVLDEGGEVDHFGLFTDV
ncbi:hypothetical protein ILYODFUR_035723 [Ilyodon furcidens]|uniref:Uncharacterized protein n=1 Tax=Ilyodon furcidens TaxID=33524 RepID=A0ABV0VMI0_9TELE